MKDVSICIEVVMVMGLEVLLELMYHQSGWLMAKFGVGRAEAAMNAGE